MKQKFQYAIELRLLIISG